MVCKSQLKVMPVIKSLIDLKSLPSDFNLGVELGTSYNYKFDQVFKDKSFNKHLFQLKDQTAVMKMILASRIEAGLFTSPTEPYEILKKSMPMMTCNYNQLILQTTILLIWRIVGSFLQEKRR